jgi:hypothetical protein
MAWNQTYTLALQQQSTGQLLTPASPYAITGNFEVNLNKAIATTTNQLEPIAFSHATLQGFIAYADTACTLAFNTTTGAPSLTLAANAPAVWIPGSGLTNPFAADVTALYVTVPGAAAANVILSALYN